MPIAKVCETCGKNFTVPPSRRDARFCCNHCHVAGKNNPRWKGGLLPCICQRCGKEFSVKPSHAKKGEGKFCSYACHSRHLGELSSARAASNRIIKACAICGKEISVKPSHSDTEGMYCSRECMAQGYQSQLTGASNPNWKGGLVTHICKQCGSGFEVNPGQADQGQREFCSQSCSATWRMLNETITGRSKGGKRADLDNRYFRSSWEANYARYLNWLVGIGEIKQWEYESETFIFAGIKRGNMTYLPDFKITNNDGSTEFHEVKGYMDDDSAVKLKRMAKYYPSVKLVLIDKPAYTAISRQMRNMIPNWETQKRR